MKIKNIFQEITLITKAIQYQRVEFALIEEGEIKKNFNPYDYRQIKVLAEFNSPSKKQYLIPAFWFRPTTIYFTNSDEQPKGISGYASIDENEVQGLETVELNGQDHYRVRFNPYESGKWHVNFLVFINEKIIEKYEQDFYVEASKEKPKGIIRIDKTNNCNFVDNNDKTFIPIGMNTAWYTSTTRKSRDYDVWFLKMKANQMNCCRIWLAPWGFALHWAKFDNFDERFDALARLDRTLELAEENDIYFMMTLLNHGQFCYKSNPQWIRNSWNVVNGGILTSPREFFEKEEAKIIYKNQLLYLIARYSYSFNIMAWELFNEVDHIEEYDEELFTLWHQEMAAFIKNHDPYHHLVTTSYKYVDGKGNSLSEIDFVNPHSYSYDNMNLNVELPKIQEQLFKKYHKPVFHSEVGIDWRSGGGTYQLDRSGIAVKQAIWAGIMGGGAGSAMNWWWDSYINRYHLYHLFTGAAKFALGLEMKGNYNLLQNQKQIVINNKNIKLIGYMFDNRIYGYLFNKKWVYYKLKNIEEVLDLEIVIPFSNGKYTISLYDTNSGEIVSKYLLQNEENQIKLSIKTIIKDIAFIIN